MFSKDETKKTYHKGQNKKAILLIHGFTSPISDTDLFFEYFSLKGYTLARPILPGHIGDAEDMVNFGPKDWFNEVEKCLLDIKDEVEEIYLVGVSFGGILSISLCSRNYEKIKKLVLLETPIAFKTKINFLLNFVHPIFEFLKIKYVKKNRLLYRSSYIKDDNIEHIYNILPIKIIGEIKRFIKNQVKDELKKVTQPCLIVQAVKSDLLSDQSADHIFKTINSTRKEIEYMPVDNHDLNLLDEEGKILMLEKIYKFLNES